MTVKNKRSVLSELQTGSKRNLDDAEKLRNSLRRLMWGQVGLVRSRDSLVRASAKISVWEKQVQGFLQTRSDLEVRNMIEVARCITEAALWRENSLGAHYRADFSGTKGSAWKVHSQIQCPESERYTPGQCLRIV